MTSDDVRRGLAYEQRKAGEHRARHVGGPGMHDYERGDVLGEVKARQTPVTKPELQRLITQKGICEVDSKAGFTQPAIEYRDRYQPCVKLISRGKKI
ncbi:hypothetical protein [Methanoregula sp.]|jgi:hypothetical protein|uniref:hypothetical protein n=1 Tax=Methanoregula sp. TaxID=2052170 RepID=UPI0035622246